MGTIQAGPHYELPSTVLAEWLERRGAESWWNVDGDPLLTGRLTFPCPADELASELRQLDRPLLVQAPIENNEACGQLIGFDQIEGLVSYFSENLHASGPLPEWANDRFRFFYLCWKGSPYEWLLAEDRVTAKQFREASASDTLQE